MFPRFFPADQCLKMQNTRRIEILSFENQEQASESQLKAGFDCKF
jgi:hypothetical protein